MASDTYRASPSRNINERAFPLAGGEYTRRDGSARERRENRRGSPRRRERGGGAGGERRAFLLVRKSIASVRRFAKVSLDLSDPNRQLNNDSRSRSSNYGRAGLNGKKDNPALRVFAISYRL